MRDDRSRNPRDRRSGDRSHNRDPYDAPPTPSAPSGGLAGRDQPRRPGAPPRTLRDANPPSLPPQRHSAPDWPPASDARGLVPPRSIPPEHSSAPDWPPAGDARGPINPRSVPPQRHSAPDWPPVAELRPPAPPPSSTGLAPLLASYVGEDAQRYALRDLTAGIEINVPKRRAAAERFPPTAQNRAPGAGLQKLSGYALLGALLGGAPGLALGLLTALIALARLARFEGRTNAWRKKATRDGQSLRLPARATSERLRLMTALWQSLGAVVLGGTALVLLLTALR